ncbi:CPBP family intramembrane glutamic endopeptidase [Phenylobacterium sp. VNQ135]|uniref:CPBP family intramembrane glutamic endopeptidase n=1 Tax=Phenylobacterium sp. VNQ135 TaxID=3400922 RepID=UPI003BFB96E1
MADERTDWRSKRSLALAAAVGAALVWTTFSGAVVKSLTPGLDVAYARSVLANLSDLVMMSLLVGSVARAGPSRLFGLTGLGRPITTPLLWAAFIFIPAVLVAALAAPVSREFTGLDLFWQGAGFPVFEEVIYRGLAIGALIRWAGWRWWAACLAPAVMFGLVHAGQGSDPGSIAGVVAVTGLGGLLFGWLFVRWDFNLWPPILLHIGMNSLWIVFALGENALGGWLGNALRLAVVAAAILLTWRMAPRPRPA